MPDVKAAGLRQTYAEDSSFTVSVDNYCIDAL